MEQPNECLLHFHPPISFMAGECFVCITGTCKKLLQKKEMELQSTCSETKFGNGSFMSVMNLEAAL